MLYKEKVIDGRLHYATHDDEWKPVTAEVLTVRLLQAYEDLYYCADNISTLNSLVDNYKKLVKKIRNVEDPEPLFVEKI